MERLRDTTLQKLMDKPGNYLQRLVRYDLWYNGPEGVGEVVGDDIEHFNLLSIGNVSAQVAIRSKMDGGGSYKFVTSEGNKSSDTGWVDIEAGEEKELRVNEFGIPLAKLTGA